MYCPHCLERLSKPSKKCPHCKKLIDFSLHGELYSPGPTSSINRSVLVKIWFTENAHLITPFMTLLAGVVIGAIAYFFYAQQAGAGERLAFEQRIEALQDSIQQQNASAGATSQTLEQQIADRDSVIALYKEQQNTLSKMISFTNRVARNSTILPDSGEATYFKRNYTYLQTLYARQAEKLKARGEKPEDAATLKTIPQLLD